MDWGHNRHMAFVSQFLKKYRHSIDLCASTKIHQVPHDDIEKQVKAQHKLGHGFANFTLQWNSSKKMQHIICIPSSHNHEVLGIYYRFVKKHMYDATIEAWPRWITQMDAPLWLQWNMEYFDFNFLQETWIPSRKTNIAYSLWKVNSSKYSTQNQITLSTQTFESVGEMC